MPRWSPDGIERLRDAALSLFDEQGFERTTVAEIAQRAGLTQRSFYNHFADKREVLFDLARGFQDEVVGYIAAADDGLAPLDAVVAALQVAYDEVFEGRRAEVLRRHRVLDANPELAERELSKRAALTDAIAGALVQRGLDPGAAQFAAGAAVLVQQAAVDRWTQPGASPPLRDLLSDALESLRTTVR